MSDQSQAAAQDVIGFWFSSENKTKWFIKDPVFDKEITEKFFEVYELAANGRLDHWKESADGTLALIILLDQFPRNMFRNTARSFVTDAAALASTKYAIVARIDKDLDDEYKQFLYMPLMHSENLEDQRLCFELSAYNPQMQNYAKRHMEIIEKFSRFPHRNKILNRQSTDEELEFLKLPNSGF